MPSSMRPTTTSDGVEVVSVMIAEGREPKANAIGTPANTMTAPTPTKKISEIELPSGFRIGPGGTEQRDQRRGQRDRDQCWPQRGGAHEAQHGDQQHQREPVGIAEARQELMISSAGVTTKFRPAYTRSAGGRISSRNATRPPAPPLRSSARVCGVTRCDDAGHAACARRAEAR